jgi:DNA-binding NtrC family response regulator
MGEQEQLNILVVDDEPAALRVLAEIVRRQGHQTVEASSAEEILALLPYWTFQVAFLDHNLPGMEGLVLGEYLRRSNPDMTIALVTGDYSPALERRTREVGLEFIQKPYRMAAILDVIEGYVTKAGAREHERRQQSDEYHAPPIAEFIADLAAYYRMPNVPSRIEQRLVKVVKEALNNLRSSQRYNERERVVALAGLLAAQVLGVSLPRASPGNRSLLAEYDAVMREQGRRCEFTRQTPPD